MRPGIGIAIVVSSAKNVFISFDVVMCRLYDSRSKRVYVCMRMRASGYLYVCLCASVKQMERGRECRPAPQKVRVCAFFALVREWANLRGTVVDLMRLGSPVVGTQDWGQRL